MTRIPNLALLPCALAAGLCTMARAEDQPAVTLSPNEVVAQSRDEEWRPLDPANTLYIELEEGRVVIELAPDFAPLHVGQMKTLARAGFYDGLDFYRVIEGFVAQGGDQGTARSTEEIDRTVAPEFERANDPLLPFTPLGAVDGYAPEVGYVRGFPAARDTEAGRLWLVHCPGAVAMARGNEPDSGGTEFYVVLGHAPRYLDRNLSVFGRVVEGQELLQRLPRGAPGTGVIAEASERGKIIGMAVASDVPQAERTALEVLRTDSASFGAIIASRRNRPEEFFVYRPDHIDVCGASAPVRPAAQ